MLESNEMESLFTKILVGNHWADTQRETQCGAGSTIESTLNIRKALKTVLKLLQIRTLLDIPCGDFWWMQSVDMEGISYVGGDVISQMVRENRKNYGKDFRHLDITSSDLPGSDLVFCRDCLVHFSFDDCHRAISNIKKSGSVYLMMTTFSTRSNFDISTGKWCLRNMQKPPFNFPTPLIMVDELCREFYPNYIDKFMGVWRIKDL